MSEPSLPSRLYMTDTTMSTAMAHTVCFLLQEQTLCFVGGQFVVIVFLLCLVLLIGLLMIRSMEARKHCLRREEIQHYNPAAPIFGMLGGVPRKEPDFSHQHLWYHPGPNQSKHWLYTQILTPCRAAVEAWYCLQTESVLFLLNSSTTTADTLVLPAQHSLQLIGANLSLLPVNHFSWGWVWYFQNPHSKQ